MLSKKILQALPELGLLVREQVFQKNLIVYCPGSLNVSCNAGGACGSNQSTENGFRKFSIIDRFIFLIEHEG